MNNEPRYTHDWIEISKTTKKKQNYICQLCEVKRGEKTTIVVHHLNQVKDDNREENLLTLCSACHQSLHNLIYTPTQQDIKDWNKNLKSQLNLKIVS